MSFKKLLLITLLASSIATIQAENSENFENPEEVQKIMNTMLRSLNPVMKKLIKKFYSEIEWLEKNYVVDRAKGDELLAAIRDEYIKISPEMSNSICDEAVSQVNRNVSEREKSDCKNFVFQMLANSMESLQLSCEIRSSAYQELLAEKNKRNG